MTRLLIIVLLTTIISISSAFGQGNPVEAMYLEANALYESARYDEAVRMYNRILQVEPDHTDAILMRGRTKYELGAYKGTKMDAVLYLEKAGATKELIQVMAATEFKLNNLSAAWGYVSTAVELDPYDAKMHYLAGQIAIKYGKKNDGCATDPFDMIEEKKEEAKDTAEEKIEDKKDEAKVDTPSDVQPTDISLGGKNDKVEEKESDALPPVNIDATQEIEVDESITIVLANGLGERKLNTKPNIFMLSDQDGLVVIDVCVDQKGRVVDAEFNRESSTLFRSSLTSLALRKAKQFTFLPSKREEQCGALIYRIKA